MPEPLRVVSVIKGLGPGGAERLLVEAARALQGLDEVDSTVVYALSFKDHLVGDLEAAGVTVRGLRVRRLADVRWVVRLVRTLRRADPDVVHVHSPALAPVVRLAAHARLLGWRRPRLVNTEHNAWSTFHWLTRFANGFTAPLDDAAFAVSEEVKASVRPRALRARVRTLRHGIDVDAVRATASRRAELRSEWEIAAGDVVVATVANYRAQKNYPVLLRAAAEVIAHSPRAQFVAVGQGPLGAEIEALHRELGLGDRFRLLGYRPDAVAVIGAADIFTLSSDYEGLPVALMEALAHGLPVVATAVGGVAETIDAGSGRLVPPGDPAALAAALIAVVADDSLRHELAEGARRLGESFDARLVAATLVDTYRTLCRRSSTRPNTDSHPDSTASSP